MPIPSTFHPAVRAWFQGAFAPSGPTPAQDRGWTSILEGRDTLIAAPTGSGKTLAAFMASIDALVHRAASGTLRDGIDIVYVSPLKALSGDVLKNLNGPLLGIRAAAAELGIELEPIRVALRTGDTSAADRARIVAKPPHVLVTTPESLYLMLTAERARAHLKTVRTVIVDEVHALMRDKRGSHLALSLARLDAVAELRPQRIGLSATVHPIEEAARYLVGARGGAFLPCAVVDVSHGRELDLAVVVPGSELQAVPTHEQWGEVYDHIALLVRQHRTTLVFVNTRRMAERAAHQLGSRLGADVVGAHHGSLSKERRLAVEQQLKAGEMRALVATASLELGIDIGSVDLVCQLGSPRAITTLLQRIGRSGHSVGNTPRGRLFATTRDELVECAALLRAVASGKLDRVIPPAAPLDVLSQQIVAECAAQEWHEDALFALVRQATPFASLARSEFDEVVASLDGSAPVRTGRAGALLHRDRIQGVLRGRRAARLVALTNGGAIPDVADYRVLLDPDGTLVGTVNEDWAIESSAGDVFVLGSQPWRIRRVESRSGVVRVESAAGRPPTVPFWLGEAPSRTWELSEEVSRIRRDVCDRLDAGHVSLRTWLATECFLPEAASAQIVDYVRAQRDALGVVPTMDHVVFERFFDESGGMQIVVHAPFGGRVNRAFGLALRKRFCVSFDFELQAAATDDAVVLSIGTGQSFPLKDALAFVRSANLRETLEQAVLVAPMFGTRWRWNASRSLAVLRREGGKKVPPFLQRMRADDFLASVFPAQVACQENVTGPLEIPSHPLVRQTLRDCLHEAMDATGLHGILERMERGDIRLLARDTTEPSPFAHEILSAKPYAFLDDAPLEERRVRALSLRRTISEHQRGLGLLDADAIARVVAEARPDPRNAVEVLEALASLLATPIEESWRSWAQELIATGRAGVFVSEGIERVFATEKRRVVEALYSALPRMPPGVLPFALDVCPESRQVAVCAIVRGHAETAGPFTPESFARRLGLAATDVGSAVAILEAEGLVLRGRFTPDAPGEEVCDRRLLARIHRYTIDRLRSEIEPVSAQDFVRALFERHGLTSRTRRGGRAGLRDALSLLQGFEAPASAWERDILPIRVAGYRSEWLDELCLAGEVTWARLSLRRVAKATATTSRATPIALSQRPVLDWLLRAVRGGLEPDAPTHPAAASVLDALTRRGALFFDDLAASCALGSIELTEALWDLVGRGLVTSDGFQTLRDLMGKAQRARSAPPKRRRVPASRGPRGRWSLVSLPSLAAAPPEDLADRVAEQLLARYGVVFREVVARESYAIPFREVLRALRRREAQGLVRGGRFVAGFTGEQYALPDAVDSLRAVRRRSRDGEVVRIRAADPLNVVGILSRGPRVPTQSGGWLVFRDGDYLLASGAALG